MVMCESVVRDELIYMDGVESLGFIKSRNLIRNNLTHDFTIPNDKIGMVVQVTNVPDIGYVVESAYVVASFADNLVSEAIVGGAEEVTVNIGGDKFNLIGGLGYSYSYNTGGILEFSISEIYRDDADAIISANEIDDDFTRKILGMYHGSTVETTMQSMKIVSGGIGESTTGYNNMLDAVSFEKLNAKLYIMSYFGGLSVS